MPDETRRRRRAGIALALALVACAPGGGRREDSAAGTVVVDLDTLHGLGVDSLPTDTTPAAVPAPRADSAESTVAPATTDVPTAAAPTNGPPPTATERELAELGAQLVIPVEGVTASELRDTYNEGRAGHVHEALDIPAPRGTPVRSAADGRLLKIHESREGGHMVYAADASDRFILMYAHLDRYASGLVEGMPLRRGQLLGYVGTTGNAPPGVPHLHFALARGTPSRQWWKGTPVNPYPLLAP